jgi:hypothetical protein
MNLPVAPPAPLKAKTIQKIIQCRNEALNQIHVEMDRLGNRLAVLSNKVDAGSALTDDEKKEQTTLLDAIDQLVAVETHVVLFSINSLDNSTQVKFLRGQVDFANTELQDTRTRVEAISQSIQQASNFLKTLIGLLGSLSGLLAVLA